MKNYFLHLIPVACLTAFGWVSLPVFAADAVSTGDKSPDIKAFAAKTDEIVKMHLSMIQDIQSKMK